MWKSKSQNSPNESKCYNLGPKTCYVWKSSNQKGMTRYPVIQRPSELRLDALASRRRSKPTQPRPPGGREGWRGRPRKAPSSQKIHWELELENTVEEYLVVSINGGTRKWMVYSFHKGKSYENGWFGGTPISGNLSLLIWIPKHSVRVVFLLVPASGTTWKGQSSSHAGRKIAHCPWWAQKDLATATWEGP